MKIPTEYCGCKVRLRAMNLRWGAEVVHPRSKTGKSKIKSAVPVCPACMKLRVLSDPRN